MAIIECDECGSSVSDKARLCPSCGYPFSASLTTHMATEHRSEESGLIALGTILSTLGLAIVVYRLLFTFMYLWLGSVLSLCCCGSIDPDELTDGFSGAWSEVGVAFKKDGGDTFMSIIFFPCWNPISYSAAVMFVLGSIMSAIGYSKKDG